jgi:hypothetical protein
VKLNGSTNSLASKFPVSFHSLLCQSTVHYVTILNSDTCLFWAHPLSEPVICKCTNIWRATSKPHGIPSVVHYSMVTCFILYVCAVELS